MKDIYEHPVMDIKKFEVENIITYSSTGDNDLESEWGDEDLG